VRDAEGRVGDVALLTLDRPVRGLDPAVLPAVVRPLDQKRLVREAGRGTTTDDAAQPAQFLRRSPAVYTNLAYYATWFRQYQLPGSSVLQP
jgi:hypothetical protein